jgi:hypothetical protein
MREEERIGEEVERRVAAASAGKMRVEVSGTAMGLRRRPTRGIEPCVASRTGVVPSQAAVEVRVREAA